MRIKQEVAAKIAAWKKAQDLLWSRTIRLDNKEYPVLSLFTDRKNNDVLLIERLGFKIFYNVLSSKSLSFRGYLGTPGTGLLLLQPDKRLSKFVRRKYTEAI